MDESDKELKSINEESKNFKNKLLLNKLDENQRHVHCFENIKIDINFKPIKINR